MSETVVSVVASVLILVFAVLKKYHLLDGVLETLRNYVKKDSKPSESDVKSVPARQEEVRNLLFAELERHVLEQQRLDEEYALVEKFLTRKKEKVNEPV